MSTSSNSASPKKKHKILIVDDDEALVSLISIALENEGMETEAALDGQAALEKIKKSPPDLILLDIMMPKMDGYQICRFLKLESKEYKHIPVILLTARAQKKDQQTGASVGADDYLTKPFEVNDLIRHVQYFLQ